ncbi:hypothetical protein Skr01_75970 [Sphaerisporangium krabiense]|uniref:DUF5107 domain-containing protein n=1 Tax=Sphaerisporangium krabiense TaxID=763782 RepID=A0A7W9DN78_9ACTN|nr:DUF5107 domain-containing protein [Sphaerisporangium krabiense]MBB5625058.1 hypothetical protein [Sphaerisporangium krabiense]GII67512.1 hypothetical protein Skr01_75970 [Sphaerisporangium krabiense]
MSTVRLSHMAIPVADLGEENPLPSLVTAELATRPPQVADADEEMVANLAYGRMSSILPYTMQDGYTRDLTDRTLSTAVVESDVLRAEFLLGLGGRMWSLVHKPTGRELLHRNPFVQVANLALRNAWFAGGVEWNLGTTGHTALTCAPVHAARVVRPDGVEVLRLWEWERMRGLAYQLDIWAPPGSPVLFVQVRIVNPNQHEVPVYWWSNIAVPEEPGMRVLAPASHAWRGHDGTGLDYVTAPDGDPFAIKRATDHFFDIPRENRKWIAALDSDGTGLVHVSTDRLRGRKLFVWGQGAGGRRWQEWLSPPGSPYLEIQAGLARTQLEHLALPAGESWSWVEAYGLLHAGGDPEAALESLLPRSAMDGVEGCLDRPPTEILHAGSGWGALESRRRRLTSPATPFPDSTLGAEQEPWLELLRTGQVPEGTPNTAPVSYQVGPDWRALLEMAPPTWPGLLHLGVARFHAGDAEGAAAAWESSLALARNPWALRNLAVVARQAGDVASAAVLLREAHSMAPAVRALAVEALEVLIEVDPAEALTFVDGLAPDTRTHGRIRMLECAAAIRAGRLERAQRVADTSLVVDDLREGEDSLGDLWFRYHEARAAAADPASTARRVREENPMPRPYDFRMA